MGTWCISFLFFLFKIHYILYMGLVNIIDIHCTYILYILMYVFFLSPILTCVVSFLSLCTCFLYLYAIYYIRFTQRCLEVGIRVQLGIGVRVQL